MGKLTDLTNELTTLNELDLTHFVNVNDPTEDPTGSSGKITVENLRRAMGGSANRKYVESLADLPTASGGEIALEPITYIIADFIDLGSDSLKLSPLGNTYILGNNLNAGLQYSGVGSMFVGNAGVLIIDKLIYLAPSGSYYDFDNSFEFYSFDSIGISSQSIGTIKCNVFSTDFVSYYDNGDGFVFADRTDLNTRTQIILGKLGFLDSKNNSTTLFDFGGEKIESIYIEQSSSEIQSNETLFNFNPSLKTNNTQIEVTGFTTLSEDGLIFSPTSLKQDYVYSVYANNISTQLRNSTVKCKLDFVNNIASTTITGIGTNTRINTTQNSTLSSLERLIIQDVVTLDFTTNTFTMAFNHGIVNNDRVFLNVYTVGDVGTLPPELNETTEYFVINSGATTFQLSLTQGGAAVNFSTNGTGIIHYRHSTGVSRRNQIIYIGIEDVTLAIAGWVGLINNTNNFDDMRAVIMKIATDGTITEQQIGSPANTNNTRVDASILIDLTDDTLNIPLKTGEGIEIRIRNDTAIRNITAEEYLLTIKKA